MSSSAASIPETSKPVEVRPVAHSTSKPAFDFLDLKAQFATIREEVMQAVTAVMESQQFILGNEVRLFEEETAAMLGAKHAIACASGSDALLLAMMAMGVGADDEVITSRSHSWPQAERSRAWVPGRYSWTSTRRVSISTRLKSRLRSLPGRGQSCRFTFSDCRPIWSRS